MIKSLKLKLSKDRFMFAELVKRDFKTKYKGSMLGMLWSVISPLITLLVMSVIFSRFFGNKIEHYTIYLFCGNILFSYFNDATNYGMTSLLWNAHIFTKINVPKYLFLFAKNVQAMINFGLTLCVFFIFCAIDGVPFTWKYVFLIYPICMMILLNLGIGLILSALHVFFRDVAHLWPIFSMLLMYASAIFYDVRQFEPAFQKLFLCNPVYQNIKYFRLIVLDGTIPSVWYHLMMLGTVLLFLAVGGIIYYRYNWRFLYYV
ncbi:MAG: ABC transporter permease [Parasporobacterium sp.]|nr:ABC transporter permease [Parasporobacterium sp.]